MGTRDLSMRLLAIVRTAMLDPRGHCCFTAGDFCYRWQTETEPGVPPQVQIWAGEDGEDRGFAWVSGDDLHLASRSLEGWLLAEMLDWAERGDVATGLRIPVRGHATALQQLLRRRRYEPADPTLVLYSASLDSLHGQMRLPPGYRVTHIGDSALIEGWVAAYRLAFAPEEMTVETRIHVNASPLFREELDLIALDPDGEIAAFALVWFDPETESGTFEPIGCVPAQQRRGLSQALMIEGLRRLQRLGARDAFVITTERRVPATRLYESLGFRPLARSVVWERR